jgi:hypothetical protein
MNGKKLTQQILKQVIQSEIVNIRSHRSNEIETYLNSSIYINDTFRTF